MVTGRVRPARTRDNIVQSLQRANQRSAFIAPDVMIGHFQTSKSFDPLLGFSSRKTIPTNGIGWGGGETVTTSDQITAGAIELVDSGAPPDLVWLHYLDLHQWDTLEAQGLPPHGDVARYDAVLERMDASLRPLLERRDRGKTSMLPGRPWRGPGRKRRETSYGVRLRGANARPVSCSYSLGTEPAAVDVPTSNTGVFNTLRALRGLEPDTTVDQSLLDLVGAANPGNGPGFGTFESQQWGFLYGNYRLLYMPRQQLVELYDVAHDSREQRNLADADPQLASQMLARLFPAKQRAAPIGWCAVSTKKRSSRPTTLQLARACRDHWGSLCRRWIEDPRSKLQPVNLAAVTCNLAQCVASIDHEICFTQRRSFCAATPSDR